MSLLAFQIALADLTASADFCARVADDPEAALAGRDLTPREVRRLASAARQQGILVNVRLYRHNRFTALRQVLPGSLHLLGDDARAMVDGFWEAMPHDRNQRKEAERFAAFLHGEMAAGRLVSPYLAEVLGFELRRYDVASRPRSRLRAQVDEARARWPDGPLRVNPLLGVATLRHDPASLLTWLAEMRPVPFPPLEPGEYHILLDCRSGVFQQHSLDATWAAYLADFEAGRPVPSDILAGFVEAEILVPSAPVAEDASSVSAPEAQVA